MKIPCFGRSITYELCSIGSHTRTDSIVSDSVTITVESDGVACVDVPVTATDPGGEAASMSCVSEFFNVFIFSHSTRFTLRSKIAITAIIIVAIARPDVHITSANVPCGSPSIDTRGTGSKGKKTQTNNLFNINQVDCNSSIVDCTSRQNLVTHVSTLKCVLD